MKIFLNNPPIRTKSTFYKARVVVAWYLGSKSFYVSVNDFQMRVIIFFNAKYSLCLLPIMGQLTLITLPYEPYPRVSSYLQSSSQFLMSKL
eukprot:403338756